MRYDFVVGQVKPSTTQQDRPEWAGEAQFSELEDVVGQSVRDECPRGAPQFFPGRDVSSRSTG